MSEYLKREDVRRAVLHNEGDAVIAAIDKLPTVEIIHCGECDNFERIEDTRFGRCKEASYFHYGASWQYQIEREVRDDYFCRDAYREEDHDDRRAEEQHTDPR